MQNVFLTAAFGRCGSTWVCWYLKNHPDFVYHGELLAKFSEQDRWLKTDQQIMEMHRDAFVPGKVNLYKSFPYQTRHYIRLLETADRVIHLKRTNMLARYSSMLISGQTGEYVRLQDNPTSKPLIHFNRQQFAHTHVLWENNDNFIQRVRPDAFQIEYSFMYEGSQRFLATTGLGVIDATPSVYQINKPSVLDRFLPEYHDEIRETLDSIGKPEWINEFTDTP